MKQEILERLFMDRALGGLTPDVAALLDAYLEKDPEQSRQFESIDDCVRLAARTYPKPPALKLPPLKLAPMPATRPVRTEFRAGLRILEMAAAFVLGIGLSFWGLRPAGTATMKPQSTLATTVEPSSQSAFWSMNRAINTRSSSESTQSRRVTWETLMHKTQSMN
jgi:hypothetical protein